MPEYLRIRFNFPVGESSVSSLDHQSIYYRVLRYLIEENRDPGRITFLALNQGDSFYSIGALTSNLNGSISFFPDFAVDQDYSKSKKKKVSAPSAIDDPDHLTLNKKFLEKRGHFTKIKKGTRRSFFKHDVVPVGNYYHWLTITIADLSVLRLVSKTNELKIPCKTEEQKQISGAIGKSLGNKDLRILQFPNQAGGGRLGVLQLFLIPKGLDPGDVLPGLPPIQSFSELKEIPDPTPLRRYLIPMESEHDILIAALDLEGATMSPILLTRHTKKSTLT